jgi:hypothetical protein
VGREFGQHVRLEQTLAVDSGELQFEALPS